MQSFEWLALVASIIMPLWNIPLIAQVIRRKSSNDMSLYWLWGVWACMLLMVPWAFITTDKVLKAFTIINIILFSGVVIVVMKYRKRA